VRGPPTRLLRWWFNAVQTVGHGRETGARIAHIQRNTRRVGQFARERRQQRDRAGTVGVRERRTPSAFRTPGCFGLRVCLLSSRRIAPSVAPARATASADWNWSSVYAACTQPAVAPMRRGPDSLLQANAVRA